MTEAGPPPVGAAAGSPGDGDLPGGASRGATPDDDGPPEWLAGVGGSAERVAVDEPRTVATPRVQLPDLGELPEVPGFEDRPDPVWELQLNRTDWPKPRVLRSGEQPRVIAFTVPKGGTGKTASAAYGAVLLAGAGHRVLYVDANTQQADGSETFDVAATAPTIYDLTNGEEVPLGSLSREAVQQILTPIIPEPGRDTNLFAMFGPRDPRQANPLIVTPALYLEALEAVEDQFDYVVVDSPIAESWRDIISDFILPKADFVAIVVTPSWPTVSNTYKWLTGVTNPKYAAEWAYPAQQVGWFFNRWEDDIDFDQQTAAEALANWRFLGTIPDFKSVRRANNRGAIPDDVEYNVALAKVFFEITRDPALEAAIESYAPRQRGSFRRVRGR